MTKEIDHDILSAYRGGIYRDILTKDIHTKMYQTSPPQRDILQFAIDARRDKIAKYLLTMGMEWDVKVSEILYIKLVAPYTNLVSIEGYADIVNNVSALSYFNKFFRWSINDVTYSDWIDLSIENLQALQLNSENDFWIDSCQGFNCGKGCNP